LYDNGSGLIYAGGSFSKVSGKNYNNIAYWDGNSWKLVGHNDIYNGTDGPVFTIIKDYNNSYLYIGGKFKTISTLSQQSSKLISSIDIYAGPTYDLQNMQLIMTNYNEPGIVNGLFYSTIVLTNDLVQSYSFS
jgi:hypothetical protein